MTYGIQADLSAALFCGVSEGGFCLFPIAASDQWTGWPTGRSDHSPEFVVLDREMSRVKNGRFVIVPAGKQSNGEGNNTDAKLWRSHLEGLLDSLTH
jgi:hypothetical protein